MNYTHTTIRTVETVLEKLLEWATDALEASSNHPVLPYAIIVLNTSHANIDQSLWDVDIATKSLLVSLSKTLHKNVVFTQYAKFWKARGRDIETVEDLMLCYYSSVRVCRCASNVFMVKMAYKIPVLGCPHPSRHTPKAGVRSSSEALQGNQNWV